jgi:type II secretory pathway pseudopilin PulG
MPAVTGIAGARFAVPARHGKRGAALLTVLVMVAVLGLAASLAGQSLGALMQREREAELLWRGLQYRQAIASYYQVKHGAQRMYPPSLDVLLRDPRFPGVVRHLRRLYPDPMTGQEWEPVKDPAEKLIGVRSTSDLVPFQQAGFPPGLEALEGKSSYREWEFVFVPTQKTDATTPAPTAPGSARPSSGSSFEPRTPAPRTPSSGSSFEARPPASRPQPSTPGP